MSSSPLYAAVVVNRRLAAVDKIFHYQVPEALQEQAQCGSIVAIPFGRQQLEGVIVELTQQVERTDLKEITAVVSPRPLFSREMLDLSRWLADTYLCPWVTALQAMLPSGLTLTGRIPAQSLVKVYTAAPSPGKMTPKQTAIWEYVSRNPQASRPLLRQQGFSWDIVDRMERNGVLQGQQVAVDAPGEIYTAAPAQFNAAQQRAYEAIRREMAGQKRPFLLFGVTGSGKTEIYLRLMAEVIAAGQQCLLLAPEIALTSQMVENLRRRLQKPAAVLHSGLTESERRRTWQRIAEGEFPVVVGARSAVFAPLPHLGLLILDEEQEGSYKQDQTPRFHGREVARKRCELAGAQLLLGSATPAVESYYQAQRGCYALAALGERYYPAPAPHVEVVDMRQELLTGNRSLFSRLLQQELVARRQRGEQSILLLNRRGYYTFISCRACGHVLECPHCAIPLAYHEGEDRLKCHYCGAMQPPPTICPQCGSTAIRHFGAGTQRVVRELERLLPQARIARLDQDVTRTRGQHQAIYGQMLAGEIDVLVGTQMVAKGLDFPRVTLAAVIAADITLNMPDFRARERTFQLLTQLTGRSGRREQQGLAIIQTYHPDDPAVQAAAAQDFVGFYRQEIANREQFFYPPFAQLVRLLVNGSELDQVERLAQLMGACLTELLPPQVVICGPAPASREKIKDRYRWQILLKGAALAEMTPAIAPAWRQATGGRKVGDAYLLVDVDPYDMM